MFSLLFYKKPFKVKFFLLFYLIDSISTATNFVLGFEFFDKQYIKTYLLDLKKIFIYLYNIYRNQTIFVEFKQSWKIERTTQLAERRMHESEDIFFAIFKDTDLQWKVVI